MASDPLSQTGPEKSRQATPELVRSQYPSNDALNTGVLCDDLCAIDIDIDNNQALVGQVVTMGQQLLGPRAPIRFRANSTRALMLYRVSDFGPGIRYKAIKGTLGNVDILTGNKQFVAYGEHETGAAYEWTAELKAIPRSSIPTVTHEAVKHFREQLSQLVCEIPSQPATFAASQPVAVESAAFIPCNAPDGFAPRAPATKHERDYAQSALRNEVAKLVLMRAGSHRNKALNVAGHSIGTCIGAGWIEPEQVESELLQAAIDCGYVAKDGEYAARATIASGIVAGIAKPRDPLPAGETLGELPANLVDPRTTRPTSKAPGVRQATLPAKPRVRAPSCSPALAI